MQYAFLLVLCAAIRVDPLPAKRSSMVSVSCVLFWIALVQSSMGFIVGCRGLLWGLLISHTSVCFRSAVKLLFLNHP